MNVAVDKFGRLVLPKAVRHHLGVSAGSELALEEMEGKIVLTVIDGFSTLKKENGILVYTGKIIEKKSIDDTLLQVREERLQQLSGL